MSPSHSPGTKGLWIYLYPEGHGILPSLASCEQTLKWLRGAAAWLNTDREPKKSPLSLAASHSYKCQGVVVVQPWQSEGAREPKFASRLVVKTGQQSFQAQLFLHQVLSLVKDRKLNGARLVLQSKPPVAHMLALCQNLSCFQLQLQKHLPLCTYTESSVWFIRPNAGTRIKRSSADFIGSLVEMGFWVQRNILFEAWSSASYSMILGRIKCLLYSDFVQY